METIQEKAVLFYNQMKTRRSIREFSDKKVDVDILLECIKAAGTAPSGANKQPWFFSVVVDPLLKKKIREAAEEEEYQFYKKRADDEFLGDLKQFNLNWEKPHLEEASALIIIFSKTSQMKNGVKERCYYPKESAGISTGILITALHNLGIHQLTHTPNPMIFLNQLLDRPKHEKPFLILAVGYKAESFTPIETIKKSITEISQVY
jgi:nitroreductase